MMGYKLNFLSVNLMVAMVFAAGVAIGQSNYKDIPLPIELRDVNEEFSGMAQLGNRVYLLPQYGSCKETGLDSYFNIYSIRADSITRVIEGKDTSLTSFNTLKVRNLEKLPGFIKNTYQGFETLTFLGNAVYMAIETVDTAANCYLLKGTIDTAKNEINIDYKNYVTLKRPFNISNAGYESITWLPQQKKLIAFYEFNASPGGNSAYLIDTSLTKAPEPVNTPFLYFRNTDAATAVNGSIYAINYFWDGDYDKYLNNGLVKNAENDIKRAIPALKDDLARNPDYLKTHTFARIIHLKNHRQKKWKTVAIFDGFKKNWEGLTLFNKGALIITDANRSTKQVTVLAYVAF
ncbi:hypothetical protein ACFQZS_17970 [Mucilaginibacter calamicampi]|uniref:Uncharacterized protein n=1 Tax=Mucilaginibacter calamicampi TaxID=1302352 RepID=A0ABW2YZX3_9SPHI